MATVAEKYLSRGLTAGTQSDHYRECIIRGAATESDAITAMLADTTMMPTTYTATVWGVPFTFIRGTASVAPMLDGNDPPTTWEGKVKYDLLGYSRQPYQTGDSTKTFEIGMQQTHVTQAMQEVSVSTDEPAYPALYGVINLADNGQRIDGVDIDVPVFTFSETHYIADASMTTSYINALWGVASNPVNDGTFRGFDAGEVRFLGVQGSQRFKGGDWELQFRFAVSPNTTDLFGSMTDPPITDPIIKKGWEYVWFLYKEHVTTYDTGGVKKVYTQVPQFAYVDQVYGTSNFTALGI